MKTFFASLFFILTFMTSLSAKSPASQDLQIQIFTARDRVLPALVNVEPIKSIYSTGERIHTLVTGSGVIFSRDGYVITNNHVVENAEKVWCTLSDRQRLSAEVIGSDPSTDVAVLRLNLEEYSGQKLPYSRLGNSDSVEVGQIVLALGSPLGFSRSVSMGVISSIDRYFPDQGQMISPYNLWIQTDAAINPGNSGGPLINLKGEVVGINARGIFMAENLGFAIPINLAREVANKLIAGKEVHRSWLGLEFQPLKELREYLGKPELKGVLVSNVDRLSPAKKAGIEAGDIITSIGSHSINATYDEDLPAIRKIVADLTPGEKIDLKIWRDGKSVEISVIPEEEPFQNLPEFECSQLGLVVKSINEQIFKMAGLKDFSGVYIAAVKRGEPADNAGLRAGDVVRLINNTQITDMNSFKKICGTFNPGKKELVYLQVLRQGATFFAALPLSTESSN